MKITLIVVGRPPASLEGLLADYEGRVRRYWKFDLFEVSSGTGGTGAQEEAKVRRTEAQKIRERIPKGSEIWALTRGGREFTSAELARSIGDRALHSSPGIAFLIGGAYGLDPELLNDAREKISLSRMTLPHGLARLFLAEQIYRAGTILRTEPYHKGGE
jgi:23S rRNA (pseudouridine1915-N3)-methyltransferase